MFSQEFKVRYSDIGPEGYAELAQIMAWFQDAATDHSEAVGYGASVLKKMGAAWIVLNWDVKMLGRVYYNQRVCVETWASGFASMYGHRMFNLKDENGEILATGESVWLLYDLNQNKFRKVTDEMCLRYGCDTKMPSEVLKKWKLSAPEIVNKSAQWTVRRSDTDTNQHTNNVSYVRFLIDSVDNGGALTHMCVTYKKALYLNENAQLDIGDGCAVISRDGEVCTLFEFE